MAAVKRMPFLMMVVLALGLLGVLVGLLSVGVIVAWLSRP